MSCATELATRLGAAELTTNHRHHDPTERDHLQALRSGEAERYLGWATASNRINISKTHDDAITSLVNAWWRDAEHDLEGAIMIAYTRADVATLNANQPGTDLLAPLDRAATALSHSTSDLLATAHRDIGHGVAM